MIIVVIGTSLIVCNNVLFMLIIFFVLTTSFVQGRVEVDLPRGEGTPPREDRTLLVL